MKLTISMNEEVKKTLEEASKRIGVSQSSYISTLIMRAEMEYQTAKIFKGLTAEQIRDAITNQKPD